MKGLAILFFAFCSAGAAQPEAARERNERGLQAYERREYAEAERLYREAISMWESLGEAYAAHLGIVRCNLGETLTAQGKRLEALPELEASVALLRRSLGVRHLDTLTAMNLLAATELAIGKDAAAGALLEEALPIERALYPEDAQLAHTLTALTCLHLRQGRPVEALPFGEEALTLAIRAAGADSLDAALAYAAVAEAHRSAGHPERALPLYRRAEELYRKNLGPQHPRVASTLAEEAFILIGEGKLATAERQLLDGLAILDRSCAACAIERWELDVNLAVVRARQGRYGEADRLLSAGLALLETAEQGPTADLASTLRALAIVRRKEKRFEEADGLDHRAAALAFR